MVQAMKDGGSFALVRLTRFEDGELYVHDGHHRCVAAYLHHYLHQNTPPLNLEFSITEWTYADYNTINIEAGYTTPFDVKTEVRVADFSLYREITSGLQYDCVLLLSEFFAHYYKEQRQMYTIKQMAHSYLSPPFINYLKKNEND